MTVPHREIPDDILHKTDTAKVELVMDAQTLSSRMVAKTQETNSSAPAVDALRTLPDFGK